MKKIITLLLLVVAFVGQAEAFTLYIENADPSNWKTIDVYAWNDSGNNNWSSTHSTSTTSLYGTTWYVFSMGDYTKAIVRGDKDNWDKLKTGDLTISKDMYITVGGAQGSCYAYQRNYKCPVFRCDLDANWTSDTENATTQNAFTFYREYTKSTIDTWAAANTRTDFKFRFKAGYDELASFWPQMYPNSTGTVIGIGSSTTNDYENTDNTSYCWQINIPSYNYEKIRLTAAYRKIDGNWKWQMSADAYVKVRTNGSGYCTYTVAAPLTISDATAYYATDDGDGSATAHSMTNPPASTPMLIKGTASTDYTFTVAATGTALVGTNAFKAGPGTTLASEVDGKYNYILNGDAFYAANGQTVAAGKAYLQLSKAASARPLKFLDDEETGISEIERMRNGKNEIFFNLKGQRVAQPSKGLYIVNGRKVIMK